MLAAYRIYSTAFCLAQALAAPPLAQVPLVGNDDGSLSSSLAHVEKSRGLSGRFLHISDFHPDAFYEVYSSTSEEAACHRGQGPAGIYGAETSECDSPIALVNQTIDYVAKEFKDNIDFVVWTGDSARHDNDDDIPRNKDQVLDLNRFMVRKMVEAFGKHNGDEEDDDPNNDFIIPIVPNLGNNDILPHNILARGPNEWTRAYATLWKQFIPEDQQHSFQQGGWFYVEVIPNKLAVFSLNTMYFFSSNTATDGCAARSEPGYRQMEWLRIQLQFMRDRGIKAILMGHVPPVREEAKTLWEETCWQKYTLWLRQYRDVIVGNIYGHFNYDHFMFQDFQDLDEDTKDGRMEDYRTEREPDQGISTQGRNDYFIQLREEWSELPEPPKSKPKSWLDMLYKNGKSQKDKQKQQQRKYLKKIGGKYAERFAASFVSPSVVPNLYPTLRIFEYNTTGLVQRKGAKSFVPAPVSLDADDLESESTKKKPPKKYKFTVPDSPSESSPPGPAYSPQTLSLLKFTQYYANLTYINNDFLDSAPQKQSEEGQVHDRGWHEGKHKGKRPHDRDHKPNPHKFRYEKLYDTQDDEVYHLPDLTMPNLIDLARRIGDFVPEDEFIESDPPHDVEAEGGRKKKGKKKHGREGKKKRKQRLRKQNEAWYAFVRRAYVETLSPEEISEEFGQ